MLSQLIPFLQSGADVYEREHYAEVPVQSTAEGLQANVYYFNHAEWAEEYLIYCHRSESFRDRWQAALGDYSDKVVVDIGCGPGNIFATLEKKPKVLIGVDVAPKSLEFAKKVGYTTLLADATALPFVSGFADIVTLNATLHHCEDMQTILMEAARLVKPGGLLVTDHDPQLSAWDYKGPAKLLWNARLVIYKMMGQGMHKTDSQQQWGLACEIHHKPGHGVTTEFFQNTLRPLGFEVAVYPHNHELGAEVLQGQQGKAEKKYRWGSLLSGRNPDSDASALSLMCVAHRS